uniref:Thioredoxin domain-containing protein n=1 Tax=Megaselia scalaris TaxID=36166 RepID=T1GC08_MEGSC
MFYAPWCGYCKKTEPIFNLVSQALHSTNIRVGRLDCTKYPSVPKSLPIRGYPTIMFFKGNQEFVYNGDRTKEDLVDYSLRMSSPAIQLVTRVESIDMLKTSHKSFFLFVGEQIGTVWTTFFDVAEFYQEHGFFYATSEEIASQHFDIEHVPALLVHKEETHYFYPHGHKAHEMTTKEVNETLTQWVNNERFLTFPKITRFNIRELMSTKKFLVIAVVEEDKLSQVATHELEFRDMIEEVIRKYRHRFVPRQVPIRMDRRSWYCPFQVMDTLPTPHLIVINSTTQHHHIPEDDPMQMTINSIHVFLESIHNQSAVAYGGDSFAVRAYRAYFETKKGLVELWKGNPVLTSVLFGLPLGFLSLILYSIFCADCMDAPEEDDEDDHEKTE